MDPGKKLMSQGTYQNHSSGLMFLFTIVGVKMDKQLDNYMKPLVTVIMSILADDKVRVVVE